MLDGMLLLGPILFQDFEIPGSISWGGEQRLAIHRLPGGARVIDALGRDDADITWSGFFSGETAAERARLLDTLRAGGAAWPLTWNAFFYSVVISRFEADFSRDNWIPYRIVCAVLQDEAAAIINAALSLADSALGDVASASAFGTTIDLSGAAAALGLASAATAGTADYATAQSSLGDASSQFDAAIAQIEPILAAAADPATAADAAGQLANLAAARDFTRRAVTNVNNASG